MCVQSTTKNLSACKSIQESEALNKFPNNMNNLMKNTTSKCCHAQILCKSFCQVKLEKRFRSIFITMWFIISSFMLLIFTKVKNKLNISIKIITKISRTAICWKCLPTTKVEHSKKGSGPCFWLKITVRIYTSMFASLTAIFNNYLYKITRMFNEIITLFLTQLKML